MYEDDYSLIPFPGKIHDKHRFNLTGTDGYDVCDARNVIDDPWVQTQDDGPFSLFFPSNHALASFDTPHQTDASEALLGNPHGPFPYTAHENYLTSDVSTHKDQVTQQEAQNTFEQVHRQTAQEKLTSIGNGNPSSLGFAEQEPVHHSHPNARNTRSTLMHQERPTLGQEFTQEDVMPDNNDLRRQVSGEKRKRDDDRQEDRKRQCRRSSTEDDQSHTGSMDKSHVPDMYAVAPHHPLIVRQSTTQAASPPPEAVSQEFVGHTQANKPTTTTTAAPPTVAVTQYVSPQLLNALCELCSFATVLNMPPSDEILAACWTAQNLRDLCKKFHELMNRHNPKSAQSGSYITDIWLSYNSRFQMLPSTIVFGSNSVRNATGRRGPPRAGWHAKEDSEQKITDWIHECMQETAHNTETALDILQELITTCEMHSANITNDGRCLCCGNQCANGQRANQRIVNQSKHAYGTMCNPSMTVFCQRMRTHLKKKENGKDPKERVRR